MGKARILISLDKEGIQFRRKLNNLTPGELAQLILAIENIATKLKENFKENSITFT